MLPASELKERMRRMEELVAKLDSGSDSELRAAAKHLTGLLMEFHGAGLERIFEIISASGDHGQEIVRQCGCDELVRSLLLLYGLHPDDLQTRVTQALEKYQPSFRSRGAEVEFLGLTDGTVRLRISGSMNGTSQLKALTTELEEAIRDVAPDAPAILVEGIPLQPSPSFVPLSRLQTNSTVAVPAPPGAGQP